MFNLNPGEMSTASTVSQFSAFQGQARDILEFLQKSCEKAGPLSMFTVLELAPNQEVQLKSITGEEFLREVMEASKRQWISGINSNARVAIIGETSIPWITHFFAALLNGATVCPVDIKLTPGEISPVLDHFEATHVLSSESWSSKALEFNCINSHKAKLIKLSEFNEFPKTFLNQILAKEDSTHDPRLVLYTSGTSGTPKGVVIKPSALFFEAQILGQYFPLNPVRRVVFSILPLNHIYGLTAGLFVNMWTAQELCMTQSMVPAHMGMVLKEKKVNRFIAVPLLLSLVKNSIKSKVKDRPPFQRFMFNFFMFINMRLHSKMIAKKIFKKVREGLSDHIDFFISGGAPLDNETSHFFDALGWPVYNGYGLTETGPVIAGNKLTDRKNGTVGRPIDGIEVKIVKENPDDEAGEIWTRGPHVFEEYYKAPEITAEAKTTDNWFKTGDLGFLDDKGYLYITGRSKSMIVLHSGKKVQPEEVEILLGRSEYVKSACVIGAKRGSGEKIVAVIQLNEAFEKFLSDSEKLQEITHHLKTLCQELASFKQPQEFKFRKTPFELTSSQKIKRHIVQKELQENLI